MTAALPLHYRFKLLGRKSREAVGQAITAAIALSQSLAIGALFFGGLAAVTYGAWLIYKPLGFIVGGILSVAFALRVSRT